MTDLPPFANIRNEPLADLDDNHGDRMLCWVAIATAVFWGCILAALLISFDPLGIVR